MLLNMDVNISFCGMLIFLGYGGSGWRYGFSFFFFLFLIVGSYCFLSLPVSDLHCMVDVGILCTLMFVSYLWNLLSFLLEWSGLMTALEWCRLLFPFLFPFLLFFDNLHSFFYFSFFPQSFPYVESVHSFIFSFVWMEFTCILTADGKKAYFEVLQSGVVMEDGGDCDVGWMGIAGCRLQGAAGTVVL